MFKSMWWSHIPNIDLFPVIAGSDNEPGENDNQHGTGGAGTGEPQETAGGGQGGTGEELDPAKKIIALTEEKDRHWQKAKEAEGKLTAAEKELEELRLFKQTKESESLSEKEKVDLEISNLKTALENKDKQIAALQESARKLVLNNAFLSANDVKWHNAERALALADLSAVEIVDKDGTPSLKDAEPLKKAIKALAESDPYLVDTTEGQPPSWQGKTGDKPVKQQPGVAATRKTELLKEYPALRR